jgi:hypothetical protein
VRVRESGVTVPLLSVLVAVASIPLGGCVAGMALGAASMAAQAAQGRPESNAELKPMARTACSDRAAHYGAVHVIDVEQSRIDRITVWGTVDDGKERRSFECRFSTKLDSFKLREIKREQ